MLWLGGALAVAGCAVLAGCAGPGATGPVPTARTVTATPSRLVTARSATPRPLAKPAGPVTLPLAPAGDGARHQTQAMPRTDGAAFRNLIADVWLSVTTGKPAYGLPAFFPEAAYEQVKAIADPAYDWRTRLWYDYAIDVAAAHKVVGSDARVVKVVVPAEYALWIPVGVCTNSIGYWHVPGARVEYEKNGHLESIGIASMISWRGVWYLIHFGGVHRTGGGMVDQPTGGEGIPGPPGGC